MSVVVEKGGLLTTVQDMGRTGYQQFGISVCGVMDPRAAALANALVGNPDGEAVLECTFLGPTLRFTCDNCIAITGGDLGAVLDSTPVPTYRAIAVRAGQTLQFTTPRTGFRAYLAFAGGLEIVPIMGSRSTDLKMKLGGYQGRRLERGDILNFRCPQATLSNLTERYIAPEFIPRKEYRLRVVLGPQDDAFTQAGLDTFLRESYTVTPQSDRMGSRLDGPAIEHRQTADIISDGISFGAIQVPPSGKPIIMLCDRQTTGGYTKIAIVISADFRLLAQTKPGDRLLFEAVSIQEAQQALHDQWSALHLLRKNFNR